MKLLAGIPRIAMSGAVSLLFLALATAPAAADCSRAAPPSDVAAYRGKGRRQFQPVSAIPWHHVRCHHHRHYAPGWHVPALGDHLQR